MSIHVDRATGFGGRSNCAGNAARPGASSLNRQISKSSKPSPSQSATVHVSTCRGNTPLPQYMLSMPTVKRVFSLIIWGDPGKYGAGSVKFQ